jgi:uracil-DNA glycosylase family 4
MYLELETLLKNHSPEFLIKELVENNCPDDYNPLDYVQDIVKPLAVSKLNTILKDCSCCEISQYNIKTLFKGTGYEPILVIGESALIGQSNNSFPFTDTEEEDMLNKVFNAYGIDISKLAFINTVNCCCARTKSDGTLQKRAPTQQETDECKTYLDYVIRTLSPKMILLIGNISLNTFKKDTIFKMHGKQFCIKDIPAFAIYTPSYFLEMKDVKLDSSIEQDKLDFTEDIKNIFLWFNEIYPEENIFINDNIKQYM